MSLRINTNIEAFNAHRQLESTQGMLQKSMEKLSSGLRINRAADDAAGLAISEKMRAQINGIAQAHQNSLDGISMVQTAEGALNEVHSILQRVRELAVEYNNGTLSSADRAAITVEITPALRGSRADREHHAVQRHRPARRRHPRHVPGRRERR